MAAPSAIQFLQLDSIGFITLHRPKALNALNHDMVIALYKQLDQWAMDPDVKAVIIQGAGDKAFCAGGDIRAIYEARHRPALSEQYFWDEYRLNQKIHHYPKPYIALLNGITMGGGVGVSLHGSCRIATEHFVFAMPEVGIGFHPDVGGSYLLSRCPGQTGTYLALTGAHISVADALYLKLVDYFVPNEKRPELVDALASTKLAKGNSKIIADIVKNYTAPTEPPPLASYREHIDDCFKFNTVEAIIDSLKTRSDEWSDNVVKTLLTKAPLSLKVTLQQLRKAATLTIDECLKVDYRVTTHFLQNHDFYEGIRATIIDKDQKPQWQPEQLSAIKPADVNAYFAPLASNQELHFAA